MNTSGRTDIALQVKHDWSLFHRGGQRETVEQNKAVPSPALQPNSIAPPLTTQNTQEYLPITRYHV